MLKKTIKYTDFDGNERTEDFYFNLTKAELMEMELGVNGGYTQLIHRITSEQDTSRLVKLFKELVLKSYGIKSLDGRRFEKSEEISREFEQTEAYSELFLQLASDADEAAKFVNGIVPADIAAEASKNPIPYPTKK